ncbi:protein-ER retention receptor [Metarhizium album ARSEF 1941]|uniref:Protein-ER retention receptor n=1 Tax=Metarhizium album (strain ARSEF 1941) TaxID=1081103 RepID=A0A0B2WNY3_METAS|nr:protein-ER retention receptor [Metarhizium album ARSEF 1941]KHN94705.1 protein-ER retention receptor [Metarhizium album ARSEF 1941]
MVFRILGDLSHLASKAILIFAIHSNRSAEGVSPITQVLYALVFCTRYLDIFRTTILWNLLFKIVYISSSFYTIGIMQWVYPRSRERELSWKLGGGVLVAAAVLSPFMMMIFYDKWGFITWMWVFSEILESGCILPQLLLLRQTTVPTVINSFYLVALGSYRALYILNWFVREFDATGRKPEAVAVIFGVIQTALYFDFAWVYYTRQRVKLRGGGIVDADDMRRGWLLRRIFGRHVESADDEEGAPALGGDGNGPRRAARPGWGARGISVSADEGMFDAERHHDDEEEGLGGDHVDPDAKMKDPDELAKALDDDDDEGHPVAASSKGSAGASVPNGMRSGDEWRD